MAEVFYLLQAQLKSTSKTSHVSEVPPKLVGMLPKPTGLFSIHFLEG